VRDGGRCALRAPAAASLVLAPRPALPSHGALPALIMLAVVGIRSRVSTSDVPASEPSLRTRSAPSDRLRHDARLRAQA
jgi:hypothetical protein